MLFITLVVNAQGKDWNFTTHATIKNGKAASTTEEVIDQLGFFPGTGISNFGLVTSSNQVFPGDATTYSGRLQSNGSGGVSTASNPYLPIQRYLYFHVDGDCTVILYAKTASNGATRTAYITNGLLCLPMVPGQLIAGVQEMPLW
ncbi:hypothetical protein FUMI01_15450 [Flavobacterium sp. UMI-01]|nr:hypothetical protein FUMI01_15450 [Flavobacterium sp. UMI-01]